MSHPYEGGGGDWNSHTFPYNLSTFTASSNVHPDLPSEPPGYDEFEFSFPSELSPSLFSRPFMGGTGHGILSPTGSSFPALSSTSHSPMAWADQYLANSPQAVAGTSTSISQAHQRQDSAVIAKKLFEDDERSALDAFFNKTLDEAANPEDDSFKEIPRLDGASAALDSTGGNAVQAPVDDVAESRKRSRKQLEPSKNAKPMPGTKNGKGKRPPTAKVQNKEAGTVAKMEAAGDGDDVTESQIPAKRNRTGSLPDTSSADSIAPATLAKVAVSGKRTSHIASEQKRRSTIKENYKTLVDMLLAGEARSGISLLGGGEDEEEVESGAKKSKPKGRGRGRKGQDGAGATKSVVLERAADYIRWLDSGNQDLEMEIAKLEVILAK